MNLSYGFLKTKTLVIILSALVILGVIFYSFWPDYSVKNLNGKIPEIVSTSATDISQCRSIALGVRACGGPEEYLVYSTKNTNEEELRKLAIKYNKYSREKNEGFDVTSICSIEMEPKLELKNGYCVAQPF